MKCAIPGAASAKNRAAKKKYCECYQNGVACSSLCKCRECKNDGSLPHLRNFGIAEWVLPALAGEVRRPSSRKTFPADFIPGQEPTFTFVPYTKEQEIPQETLPPTMPATSGRKRPSDSIMQTPRRTRRRQGAPLQCIASESSLSFADLASDDTTLLSSADSEFSASDSDWAELEYAMLSSSQPGTCAIMEDVDMLELAPAEEEGAITAGTNEGKVPDDTHSVDTMGSGSSPILSGTLHPVPAAIQVGVPGDEVAELIDPESCISCIDTMGALDNNDGLKGEQLFKGVPLVQADAGYPEDEFVLDDFLTCEAC